ncbi:hypothetical protein AgCh_003206 [Apium graveolens]
MSVQSVLSLFFLLLIHQATSFHQEPYENSTEVGKVRESSCNLFEGSWVYDDSYPLYDGSICDFTNPGLNCQKNGRPDKMYLKYRWKPIGCNLARFDGKEFLERSRGKKIMFVGDSLSSNQWQSLACMVQNAVPDAKYTWIERKSSSSLTFPEFGVSINYMKDGFLVDLEFRDIGKVLRLDSISINRSKQWKDSDILIFNSYHWWLHTGRLQTWDYFQVGDKVIKEMDHMEAYKIALSTWAKWVDSNIESTKTQVFFQGITAVHYEGKEWDEPVAKSCIGQTQPIPGSNYPGKRYPGEPIVKSTLAGMATPVILLDITLLTQLRKDGHPSRYADGGIDCSHWCVAGVPDAWNEILYTILVDM